MFIDTHAHIYSEQFIDDKGGFLKRASAAQVFKILMPAIDSQSHKSMLELETENPDKCISMMGLHPCSVTESFEKELDIIDSYLQNRRFIAIGETGLDFYWDLTFKEQQLAAFNQQMDWAIDYNIPIVIHSRNSTKECIDAVEKKRTKD
nr:TatD family hydrolase [Niabella ginsengisoli]